MASAPLRDVLNDAEAVGRAIPQIVAARNGRNPRFVPTADIIAGF